MKINIENKAWLLLYFIKQLKHKPWKFHRIYFFKEKSSLFLISFKNMYLKATSTIATLNKIVTIRCVSALYTWNELRTTSSKNLSTQYVRFASSNPFWFISVVFEAAHSLNSNFRRLTRLSRPPSRPFSKRTVFQPAYCRHWFLAAIPRKG